MDLCLGKSPRRKPRPALGQLPQCDGAAPPADFERRVDGERVLVAINAAGETYHADFNAGCGTAVDLITGQPHDFGGGSDLPPYSCAFWRMEH